MVRRLSIIILVILAVVSVVSVNFPLISYAAGTVTVTDHVSFTGSIPQSDSVILYASTQYTNKNVATGSSSKPTISGKDATFVIPVRWDTTPVPNGTFHIVTNYAGTGSITIRNGTGSATVNSSGNYSTKGQTTYYDKGHIKPPGCYIQGIAGWTAGNVCNGQDTNGNTINSKKNCYIDISPSDNSTSSNWILANCNGLAVAPSTAIAGSPKSSAPTSTTPTCQAGGVLDWVYCSIYDTLNSVTQTVFNDFLVPELKTSPICISPTGSGCQAKDPIYAIWSSFRIYGDIILVIALLVAVISEAMGGGLLDAYAVRKILPRILAAAILINLSIYIVAAMVDVTNIIGGGIGAIITAPLKGAGAFTIKPDGTVGVGALALFGAGALLSLTHLSALFSSSGGGGSFLVDVIIVPALLILLSILLTIIIRKVAIIALIIVAPLAFAFYCLPSTEKYFKKWWDLMKEMLMVYPIIVLIFAVSSVFSVLLGTNPAGSSGTIGTALNSVLTLAATIIPLILIPFSFKLAGDTLGRMNGAVEGVRSKVSTMHEGRRKKARENYQRQVISNKANMYGRIERSKIGKTLRHAPIIGGRYGTRLAKATQASRLAAAEYGQTPGAKVTEHDDLAHWAQTRSNHHEAVSFLQEKLKRDHSDWTQEKIQQTAMGAADRAQASGGFGRVQAIHAARQLAVTGTGYKDLNELSSTIAYVSGGSEDIKSSLSGDINAVTKQVNRHDLAPGASNLKNMVDLQEQKGMGKPVGDDLEKALSIGKEQAWASGSIYAHANDKPQDIQAAVDHFTPLLRSADTKQQDKALVFFKELGSIKQNATGDVRDVASEALETNKVLYGTRLRESQAETPSIIIPGVRPEHIESRDTVNNRKARTYNPEAERLNNAASGAAGGGGSTSGAT